MGLSFTVAPQRSQALLQKIRDFLKKGGAGEKKRVETKDPVHLSKERSSFICAEIPAPVAPYKAKSHANYKPRLSVILHKPPLMKQICQRVDLLHCVCVCVRRRLTNDTKSTLHEHVGWKILPPKHFVSINSFYCSHFRVKCQPAQDQTIDWRCKSSGSVAQLLPSSGSRLCYEWDNCCVWAIPVCQLSCSGQDIYKTNVPCLTLQRSISRSQIVQLWHVLI